MSKTFTLYLDEIQANNNLEYFCLAGIIIEDEYYQNEIKTAIDQIKMKHFDTIEVILHEKDIRNPFKMKETNPFKRLFKRKMGNKVDKQKEYFEDVVEFFKENEFKVLSASLHQDNAVKAYPGHRDKYFITLQIILENFTHFLIENNTKGNIMIESRSTQIDTSLDDQLDMHFTKLRSVTGTLFYEPQTISKYIKSISFKEKSMNEVGLQIADMIPNPLNRHLSGVDQSIQGIYEEIERKTYEGNRGNVKRFGKKVLVKTETPSSTVAETPASTVAGTPSLTVVEAPSSTVAETPVSTVEETPSLK